MRHTNKQLGAICIKVEFELGCIPISLLKGVVCKGNSKGPRTEPCGTPNSSSHNSEMADSILIAWNGWLR